MRGPVVGIVQARMGSTRSPGKVLRVAAGKTLLAHLVERLGYARRLDRIVVATSTCAGDDPIAALCRELGVECVRGSESDVLSRYVLAARAAGAETVVRITADCPLIDPGIVDQIIGVQQDEFDAWDLVTNRYPLTFPDGLDVDVMPMRALEMADERATTAFQREHVIPFFWETGCRVRNVEHPDNLFPHHRWTVDYEDDVQFVTAVFEALYSPGAPFGIAEILAFVDARPDLMALNAQYLPHAAKA